MTKTRSNIYGATFMMASMLGYILNDTIIKYFASDVGLFQTIFIRGLFVTILISLVCWIRGAFKQSVKKADWPFVLLRSGAEMCATILFLTALFNMPLANISAILQTLPLTVTLLGAVILGERFGIRRTIAIAVGFLGVLLIIKPGTDGFNYYSLVAICAVFFITIRELATRKISTKSSTLLISLITGVSITISGGFGIIFMKSWISLTPETLTALATASIFIFMGYYFSIPAMQFGDISFVSPFRFTLMIWAVLIGFLVFKEFPDNWSILGLFTIIGSGIFTYYREYLDNKTQKD
jgi:drug/metabolite transporter (DMT)-like permease